VLTVHASAVDAYSTANIIGIGVRVTRADTSFLSPGAKPTEDVVRDLLEPAIQGTVSILQAATKEPSIEAVVFTSS
jgi:hypothetical protein